jgi:serine/threonine protein kinase
VNDANVGRLVAQKYELVRLLGRGGMGAVYEGRNQIGKRVVVKLLVDVVHKPDVVARFLREAQAAAAVESRHVVDVYDAGIDEATGAPFIIMAFLTGQDLEQLGRQLGPLNPTAAVRIASQAATGLAKAHEAGIVHRDIKPANLFLATDEGESVVKILDFGIAKLTSQTDLSGSGEGYALTQSGALLGTPLYMSPEQAQGLKTVDARTDVWSLGMCLYQALAGKLPFGDVDTIGKLIVAIVASEVPPLTATAPWVHPDLSAVVHQALERDVDRRILSARDFITALSPFLNGGTAITPDILVGVHEMLDATLAPGASSYPVAPRSTPMLAGSATTAGLSSGFGPAAPPKRRPVRAAIVVTAGVVLVAGAVAFRLRGSAPPVATSTPSDPPSGAAPSSAGRIGPTTGSPEESKVGVLSIAMPAGYSVRVNGFTPGSPESHGASRLLTDGKLELRGDFQTKFLVAIFDATGKRVMVQDVYLYDNKLDPETIDTTLGAITVEKPKRRSSAPTPTSLPARF